MRKDINVFKTEEGGVKVNKSELARQHGCCWETIDRRLNPEKYKKDKVERIYKSKLDPFKSIIDAKLEKDNLTAKAIEYFLREKHDYNGKYGIVRKYVSDKKKSIITELTIRFETIPGYQSQVDWKETITLHDKYNNKYIVNIFLIVLGNSRFKFIKLTLDKTQPTLFNCLIESFKYFGGITEEILFDNMKTIVDHSRSNFSNPVINTKTLQFAKDAGFEIITCRAYRPRTKGKVETLAKIMNRLKAFDYEFEDIKELDEIVEKLNYNLNYEEKSQAINEKPIVYFEKEKESLKPVNINLLESYIKPLEKSYKVSNESMIKYKGFKYSVPIRYIHKYITVIEDENFIHLYYNTELINSYDKNNNFKFNYKEDDFKEILHNSAFRDKSLDEISEYTLKNLKSLDNIKVTK